MLVFVLSVVYVCLCCVVVFGCALCVLVSFKFVVWNLFDRFTCALVWCMCVLFPLCFLCVCCEYE